MPKAPNGRNYTSDLRSSTFVSVEACLCRVTIWNDCPATAVRLALPLQYIRRFSLVVFFARDCFQPSSYPPYVSGLGTSNLRQPISLLQGLLEPPIFFCRRLTELTHSDECVASLDRANASRRRHKKCVFTPPTGTPWGCF